ncbi:MAG: HAMP domain-containing histidine kinase [Elusimicrobia bacterium]|nr:HAMP domain-containing histidine kinase [Elusimicrobiota bacterium]
MNLQVPETFAPVIEPVAGAAVLMAVHDLRNKLQLLLGYGELIRSKPSDSTQAGAFAERIVRLADSAVELANRLGHQALRPVPRPSGGAVALAELVQETADVFEGATLAWGRHFSLILSDEGILVSGDAAELRRAVENLLVNALHHARSQVVLALLRSETEAIIHVGDDGPGFAAGDAPRFAPFARGRGAPYRGSGLGLAIVRKIARAHGGEVTAHSEGPGRGARFTLRLPLAHDAPAAVA